MSQDLLSSIIYRSDKDFTDEQVVVEQKNCSINNDVN